jgi:hypothetical protein
MPEFRYVVVILADDHDESDRVMEDMIGVTANVLWEPLDD